MHSYGTNSIDLSDESVDRFWAIRGAKNVIRAMESSEPWAVDSAPGAESILDVVCKSLSEASENPDLLAKVGKEAAGSMIDLIGYLRSGRGLALFSWLLEVRPDVAQDLLISAQKRTDDFSALLLDRIATVDRLCLVSRIFSPERVALVLDILEELGLSNGGEK